jgi:uncharacterized membrane-anchored protein YhcB (DUF1043 family)
MDIKEIKINLLFIRDRLNGVDQRLNGMDQRFDAVDQRLNSINQRFDSFEQSMKQDFGQVLQLLTTLTHKLE